MSKKCLYSTLFLVDSFAGHAILYRKPCPSEFRMHQFIVFQLLLVGLKIRVHPDSLFFANDLFFFFSLEAFRISFLSTNVLTFHNGVFF